MRYVLGIDFGGGACKATLLSQKGKAVCTAVTEYGTRFFADGGAEQDPADWYRAACKNISDVLKEGSVSKKDIACVAFDGATHTAVLTDGERVLRPAVYWTDTRSRGVLEKLDKEKLFECCKHYPDTIWTLPQLVWIKEREPEIMKRVGRIYFAKDYVRHLFTGDNVTDHTEAQGSMLYDFDKKDWDDSLLALAGVSRSVMPELLDPLSVAGKVNLKAAKDSGLEEGTPVIVGTTDTAQEVFASGACDVGQTSVKLATAGRICVVTRSCIADRHLVNYSHVIKGYWYPGTATKSCAGAYRWFRDTFGVDYEKGDALASAVPAGAEGMFFHPYLNGELTPYGDPNLTASFVGITARHTLAHFARAVLEGVAFSLLDCKKYLERRGVSTAKEAFAIGGGAKSALWRQILSSMLDLEFVTTEQNDSSFGSAMCAGVAAGFFADPKSAVKACSRVTGRTLPDPSETELYSRAFETYKKIQSSLAPRGAGCCK